MKIAMYMPRMQPGSMSWTIYNGLATALRERGAEVEIWSDPPEAVAGAVDHFESVPREPTRWHDRAFVPFTRAPRLLPTTRALAAHLERRADVDILYSEIAYPYGAAAAMARQRSGWSGRLVIKPTGEDVLTIPEASYGYGRHWIPRTLTRWTLGRADAIRCISPLVEEAVTPFTDAPMSLIPSAVAPATVEMSLWDTAARSDWRTANRARLQERLGLSDTPIVLALGRLHPFKGLETALLAIRELPEAALVVAGPARNVKPHGDHGEWLRRKAVEMGVSDRVHFTGPVPHEEVAEWLGAASVVVVPSILESMNKVSVEAVATGTPFIATSTTGITHYLAGDGVGQKVPPSDPDALARAIAAVLSGTWQFDADAGAMFVAQFAPGRAAQLLLDLIDRIDR